MTEVPQIPTVVPADVPVEGVPALFSIPPGRERDPIAYAEALATVIRAAGKGEIKSTDAHRLKDLLNGACEDLCGIGIAQAQQAHSNPIAHCRNILAMTELELTALKEAIRRVDELRLTTAEKSRWIGMIDDVLDLQRQARKDPAKCWLYCFRNDDPHHVGEVLDPQWFHVRWFDIWNDPDPEAQNSHIEAPVGHGKSSCVRAQMAWEVGDQPNLRVLYITDEKEKAKRTVQVLHRTLKSDRYRALFPDVRVIGRAEQAEQSSYRLTITRPNWESREPTFEAAGISSGVQGNRYDRIRGDDVCPPAVRTQPTVRRELAQTWVGVVEGRIGNAETSRIHLTGTPWHPDDTLGVVKRAIEKGQLQGWVSHVDEFRIKDDAYGKAIPLWPKRYNQDFLENRKVRDGSLYDFKYRLIPATTTQRIVKRVWFYNSVRDDPLTTAEDREKLDTIAQAERWLSIDPAGTAGKGGSDSGIVEIALTPRGVACVTNCWKLHEGIVAVTDKVVDLVLTAVPKYAGVHWEAAGAWKATMPAVLEGMVRRLKEANYDTKSLQVITTDTNIGNATGRTQMSKIARLQQCAGFFEGGVVRFAGRRVRYRPGASAMRAAVGQSDTALAVLPGGDMERLTQDILNATEGNFADWVDAVTQWLLRNRHRIYTLADKPVAPAQTGAVPRWRSALAAAHQTETEELIRRLTEPEAPFAEEQEFLVGMGRRAVA